MKSLRSYTVFSGITVAYIVLGLQLYDLQIAKGSFYSLRAATQYRLAGFMEPHRGLITITDKNGDSFPIAGNQPHQVVIAVPREIKDIDAAVENLSPILGMDADTVRAILGKKGSYQVLLKDPTPEQAAQIAEADIAGIRMDEQEKRLYGLGSLASHVVGFVAPSGDDAAVVGRYGIEKQFEKNLAGTAGSLENGTVTDATQGTDIALTLDRQIQTEAEKTLKNLITEKNAEGGTIIVQEPATGKIIAMASAPDFNPATYSDYSLKNLTNPAVQARYEPGSVFKVITAAIGLETKAFTPETTYYDTGALKFDDGKVIRNWDLKAHGTVTMTNVIEESLNTGAAFMQTKIGNAPFYKYLTAFGFADPTGVELPGEVGGNLKNIKTHKADIDFAAASFGQGVAVTPLQMIAAVGAIANRGPLMKPYITLGAEPITVRTVLTKEAADQTTAMMISAVDKARVAHIQNFTVAGKTGTAQAVDLVHGGYTKDVINTYTGFFPASKPKIIILIKLDKPAGAPLAGTTVVPAFRKLAEFIINYYGIPPDNLQE
ncbi:MAG: penicillin-binding protein 2 [Candidatus Pacebacteria bacterium]|nr:penicillin-binding protein 2 [Candidatus Paceibacterota bacterium]